MTLPMFTVYRQPADLPDVEYAVRAWLVDDEGPKPGEILGTGATLDEVRAHIPATAGFCLHRAPEDDPTIVETWL